MCGIVGAVAQRDVSPVLLEGLKRLEYRGYDSAGLAVIDSKKQIQRIRVKGKVNQLKDEHSSSPLEGGTGIAHTRWATHGKPHLNNAHPHICRNSVALVHNGIITSGLVLKEIIKRRMNGMNVRLSQVMQMRKETMEICLILGVAYKKTITRRSSGILQPLNKGTSKQNHNLK